MTGETVLRIENLEKTYPNGTKAVDSLSLSLQRGEVFGVLGPNGSGKTTTILMLLGLTDPSGGKVDILGLDPFRSPLEVKRRVAYMPDTVGFYDELTARENLDYSARFLGLDAEERKHRITDSLEKMRLSSRINERVGTFSHGMRRRLGLAEVLLKQPEIAILDEPTQGLDPESASEFLELITYLKKEENITILLSSHLLNQVQSVCDRVGLFFKGKMVISGTVAELSSQILGGKFAITIKVEGTGIPEQISGLPGVISVESSGDGYLIVESEKDIRPDLVEAVGRTGGKLYELSMHRHSLDAVYKAYFKEAVNET